MVEWMTRNRFGIQAKPDTLSSISAGVNLEHCLNPWDDKCKNTDIAVYIVYKGRRIPLCWKCWRKISKNNVTWEAY